MGRKVSNADVLFVMSTLAVVIAAIAILASTMAHRRASSAADRAERAFNKVPEKVDNQYAGELSPSFVQVTDPRPQIASAVRDGSMVGPHGSMLDVRVNEAAPLPPMDAWATAAGEPFSRLGIVYSASGDKQLPLYGRATPYHRGGRMQYFVSSPGGHIQVSPRVGGRDCAEQLGCEELSDGDKVAIPELGEEEMIVKLNARR